jgi:hypothetical protein
LDPDAPPEEAIDSFLISTEELDELCDAGKFQRQVCRACGSRDIDDIGTLMCALFIPFHTSVW